MLGIVEVLGLLTDPGDAVVINPPVYPPFRGFVEHAGRRVVTAPLGPDGRLDLEVLGDAFAQARARRAARRVPALPPAQPDGHPAHGGRAAGGRRARRAARRAGGRRRDPRAPDPDRRGRLGTAVRADDHPDPRRDRPALGVQGVQPGGSAGRPRGAGSRGGRRPGPLPGAGRPRRDAPGRRRADRRAARLRRRGWTRSCAGSATTSALLAGLLAARCPTRSGPCPRPPTSRGWTCARCPRSAPAPTPRGSPCTAAGGPQPGAHVRRRGHRVRPAEPGRLDRDPHRGREPTGSCPGELRPIRDQPPPTRAHYTPGHVPITPTEQRGRTTT